MRLNMMILAVVLSLLATVVGLRYRASTSLLPVAQQGVLDLREYELKPNIPVALNGEWRLYRQRLVPPESLQGARPSAADSVMKFPGGWKKSPPARSPDADRDQATLHLRLLLPSAHSPLALRLMSGYSYANHSLWVNGRLASIRSMESTANSNETPPPAQIVLLPNDAPVVDLVFQVSSFQMSLLDGVPFSLGYAAELTTRQNQKWTLAVLSLGTLLLMGFYHLALYAFRRKNRTALYFAVYCLLWMGQVLCMPPSDWIVQIFAPDVPGEILYRGWQLFLFLVTPVGYLFYRSLYPEEFPRWLLMVFAAVSGLYVLLAVAAPVKLLSGALPFFFLVTLIRLLFTAWALFCAASRRREGALIFFNVYVLIIFMSINDMLNGLNVIDTATVLHHGATFFMFIQAIALAMRFSNLFSTVEQLTTELVDKNLALEEEMAERTRLQHEVVSISEEERRRLSHELHDGLCQQLTGARLRCAGLEKMWSKGQGSEPGAKELADLSALLEKTVDHAYDLSHGLWPMEPDSEDICASLAVMAHRQQADSGIPVFFTAKNPCAACAMRHAVQLAGIAREAIANAVKHARPSRIEVTLDCSDRHCVTLTVSDNGIGRDAANRTQGGLGERIMAYRARIACGVLSIGDELGGGTRVSCSIPCAKEDISGASANERATAASVSHDDSAQVMN